MVFGFNCNSYLYIQTASPTFLPKIRRGPKFYRPDHLQNNPNANYYMLTSTLILTLTLA